MAKPVGHSNLISSSAFRPPAPFVCLFIFIRFLSLSLSSIRGTVSAALLAFFLFARVFWIAAAHVDISWMVLFVFFSIFLKSGRWVSFLPHPPPLSLRTSSRFGVFFLLSGCSRILSGWFAIVVSILFCFFFRKN